MLQSIGPEAPAGRCQGSIPSPRPAVNPVQNDVAPFSRPATIAGALAVLAHGPARLVAGGTDLYATGSAAAPTNAETTLVDLGAIAELRGIARLDDGALWIGATTTWSEVAAFDGPPVLDALRAAAREVGGIQIQNRGTVAGNLCNASPAANGIPPLLALDARVVLRSPRGRAAPGADRFRHRPAAYGARRRRAGLRGAVAGAAAGRGLGVRQARCAPLPADLDRDGRGRRRASGRSRRDRTRADRGRRLRPEPVRLGRLEQRLRGLPAGKIGELAIDADELVELAPIDDVRASARYRREAAAVLVRRALGAAWASAVPGAAAATGTELQ